MIFDKITNKETYYNLGKGFALGFDFIEKCRKQPVEPGKYELDGDAVYALVQEYDTKEQNRLESHDKYIDIQFILKGSELMLWAARDDSRESAKYNPEKDITFYEENDNVTAFEVNDDEFAVFFPGDVHKPGMKINESLPVKKVLIKIHI